jgi:hypothetical protein
MAGLRPAEMMAPRGPRVYLHQATPGIAQTTKSGRVASEVMAFIRSLAHSPDTAGDFPERDESSQTVHVKIIGRYAVTFWTDHPVCEVKVTHIKPADKYPRSDRIL